MNTLIKKSAIASLAAIGILSASFATYAGYQSKYILEYQYMSGSTVVGEQIINQCTGHTYTTGQVTNIKNRVGSEPCEYSF